MKIVAENIVRTTDTFLMVPVEHCLFSLSVYVYLPYAGFTHKHTQIHSMSFSVPLLPSFCSILILDLCHPNKEERNVVPGEQIENPDPVIFIIIILFLLSSSL